jgi:secreted trypsin-like serine protease
MELAAANDATVVGIAAGYGTYERPKIVDTPDIFRRVSNYAKWIDAQICMYSKHKSSTTTCPPTCKLRTETTSAL